MNVCMLTDSLRCLPAVAEEAVKVKVKAKARRTSSSAWQ
jgi:hypothetical protein